MTNIEQALLGGIIIILCVLYIAIKEYMDLKKEYRKLDEKYEWQKEETIEAEKRADALHERCYKEIEKTAKAQSQAKELEGILKALIYNFGNYEVEVTEDDIHKAERGNIYIEDSFMKFAKRVKLLFAENYFDTKKEG